MNAHSPSASKNDFLIAGFFTSVLLLDLLKWRAKPNDSSPKARRNVLIANMCSKVEKATLVRWKGAMMIKKIVGTDSERTADSLARAMH